MQNLSYSHCMVPNILRISWTAVVHKSNGYIRAASYPLVRPFLRPIKNRNPIRLVFERTLVTKKIPNLHQSQIQQWSNWVSKTYDHSNRTKTTKSTTETILCPLMKKVMVSLTREGDKRNLPLARSLQTSELPNSSAPRWPAHGWRKKAIRTSWSTNYKIHYWCGVPPTPTLTGVWSRNSAGTTRLASSRRGTSDSAASRGSLA